MKIVKCTGSREYWYVTTKKATIYPSCGEKSVRKSILVIKVQNFFTAKNKRKKINVTSFLRHLLISKSLSVKTTEYKGLLGGVDIPTDLDLFNSNSFYFP